MGIKTTKYQWIAVTRKGQPLALRQMLLESTYFKDEKDTKGEIVYLRALSDATIEADLKEAGLWPCVRWRKIKDSDIPAEKDRKTRAKWRDDGKRILVK